jgi:hypothetical protein
LSFFYRVDARLPEAFVSHALLEPVVSSFDFGRLLGEPPLSEAIRSVTHLVRALGGRGEQFIHL